MGEVVLPSIHRYTQWKHSCAGMTSPIAAQGKAQADSSTAIRRDSAEPRLQRKTRNSA